MERTDATVLANAIRAYASQSAAFTVEERVVPAGGLQRFHEWADGRPCEAAFRISKGDATALWTLLIDWKKTGNFYLVLFPDPHVGPLAELHRATRQNDVLTLHWRYIPIKRDNNNSERKTYFAAAWGSTDVSLSVPKQADQVGDFLAELFSLAEMRRKADRLDADRPSPRDGFVEGKEYERRHLARERNSSLVLHAKAIALQKYGRLECECCGFDFEQRYGPHGKGFIEAHHTIPISELPAVGGVTRVEDIALVCSNCHRMLHVRRPWLRRDALRELIRQD